jgi:hypothetical protein
MMAPRRLFTCFAALLTAAVGYAVYVTPLNCNDFLEHLFRFESQTLYDAFAREFIHGRRSSQDWRPLQLLIGHVLYHAIKGYEHLAFKGLLVVSLFGTTWLFMRLVPVRNWSEATAAAIALLMLFGHQSFAGAVEGVYPYGVDIILLICEFAVLAMLLRERPSLATEAAAIAISLFAILLNEKGGLVGVTWIVGAMLHLPGSSRRSAIVVFGAYLAVVVARFSHFATISGMAQRDLGASPARVLFDMVAAPLNMLISDPRFGRFRTFPQAFAGYRWAIVTAVSSVATLLVIVAWAVGTFDRRNISNELKVAALLAVMLAGSMMFGAFSPKDYIPIMALPAYVVVSFYALRWLFARAVSPATVVIGIVLLAGWGIRTAGLFYYMHRMGYDYQSEWNERWEFYGRVHQFDRAITTPIVERLRSQATSSPITYPDDLLPKWMVEYLRGRGCPEFCGKYD